MSWPPKWENIEERVYALRLRAKLGQGLSPEEQAWLMKVWKEFPERYREIGAAVYDAAAAHVRGDVL